MNATQAENLRILIRHMETNVTRTLDMLQVSDCGTPACALGEAKYVVFRKEFRVEDVIPFPSTYDVGAKLFGLSRAGPMGPRHRMMYALFSNNLNGKRHVSPQEWAAEARKVLAENGYAMDEPKVEKPDAFAAFMAKVREPVAVEA